MGRKVEVHPMAECIGPVNEGHRHNGQIVLWLHAFPLFDTQPVVIMQQALIILSEYIFGSFGNNLGVDVAQLPVILPAPLPAPELPR